MARLTLALLLGAASGALGFAAVGWVLYTGSASAVFAAQWFGCFGAMVGLLCGGLHLQMDGLPQPAPAALPAHELAGMVRATLAKAAAERQGRPGAAASPAPAAQPAPAAGDGGAAAAAPLAAAAISAAALSSGAEAPTSAAPAAAARPRTNPAEAGAA